MSEGTPSNPSAQTAELTTNPAVNAQCLFAYGNEEDDPKGIKGFLLQEHADTDTSVASLADARASNRMNGPNNMVFIGFGLLSGNEAALRPADQAFRDEARCFLREADGRRCSVLADRLDVTSHQLGEIRPVRSN